MAHVQRNAVVNDLLIDLARCLLQYVGECWPWTAGDESERRAILELVDRQGEQAAALARLLDARRHPTQLGTYPTQFTDLHYLALEHLLGRLIASEEGLIKEIDRAANACAGDDEAVALLEQVLAEERDILDRLRDIAAKNAATHAVGNPA